MADLPFDVRGALALCGVDDAQVFQERTAAQRISNEVFLDDFNVCMDKTYEELKDELKIYSRLNLAEGRIRILPGVQNRIRAFMQWTRDCIRQDLDPTSLLFPVGDVSNLLYRNETHDSFVRRSKTLSEAAKPATFTKDVRWEDFQPNLVAYLRLIPGRNGQPISYVVRDNIAPDRAGRPDFLDEYVSTAPLHGASYATDNATVHTIIQHLIAGNEEAESKVITLQGTGNGRGCYIALKEHYQGVGVLAMDVTTAESTLNSLFYNGEKRPYMWWAEFERQLTHAYAVLDRTEGRQVYSDHQKLRKLLSMVKADFLGNQKAAIEVEVSRIPMTVTYNVALTTFRNAVNTKFPSSTITQRNNPRRNIRQVKGKKRGNDNGSNGKYKRRRTDSEMIKLPAKDGKPPVTIEYHPSFHFPSHLLQRFTPDLRSRLEKERTEYRKSKGDRSRQESELQTIISQQQAHIQQLQTQNNSSSSLSLPPLPPPVVPNQIQVGQAMAPSEMTVPQPYATMMGGRNEQSQLRHQRSNNSHIGQVITAIRQIEQTDRFYPTIKESPDGTKANNEADTNADTIVAGCNFTNIGNTNRVADVYGFTTDLGKCDNVPIATAATAWTDPQSDVTYILVFHETLFYGDRLDHSLINPNNLRHYGIDFWDNPYDKHHDLSIEVPNEIIIPLKTKGTKVLFTTHKPLQRELSSCPMIYMNSANPWNPKTITMGRVRSAYHQDFKISTVNVDQVVTDRYLELDSDQAILDSVGCAGFDIQCSINQATVFGHDIPDLNYSVSTDRH